jgi:group II intron reverse transcriptase/maturase
MTRQLELPLAATGEARTRQRSEEERPADHDEERSGTRRLMEAVVHPQNIQAALKRVRQNKGSPGTDGMTVDELPAHWAEHGEALCEQLLTGRYQPSPVREHQIPKSDGGMRKLGIPTALDRLVQQAILQVLQPRFDPTFSQHSYGFRPKRSAQQAICRAQQYIATGRTWVVDVDLEKFFDRVGHDVLMGRLAKRIGDKRMLGLIRRFLRAGILAEGVVTERYEGTPQGGPLSPLLANVLLDEVDKELERRGHAFVRYADDCNVYVRSKRAAERVMNLLARMYGQLKLRINESKSAVAPAWGRKFLAYCFRQSKDGVVRRAVAPTALAKVKDRIRELTARNVGRSIQDVVAALTTYLRGWKEYFRLAEHRRELREVDGWTRHRLRALQLKHWRRPRTIYREMLRRGAPDAAARRVASKAGHWWRTSGKLMNLALSNRYFARLGLPSLAT